MENMNLLIALADAKRGCDESTQFLIDQAQPLIASLIKKYNPDNAIEEGELESVCLEAFYTAIVSFDLQNPSFYLYSKKVIANRLQDFRRSLKRYKRTDFEEVLLEDVESCIPATDNDIEDRVMQNLDDQEKLKEIYGIVRVELSKSYRDVFWLYFIEQKSIREISEILGISYGAAAVRKTRVIEKIKESLRRKNLL